MKGGYSLKKVSKNMKRRTTFKKRVSKNIKGGHGEGNKRALEFMRDPTNKWEDRNKIYDARFVVSLSSSNIKCPKFWKFAVRNHAGSGCGFTIWKVMAKKKLSFTHIKILMTKRKTDLIKGFKSKTGKSFEAYLLLNQEGKVEFEFKSRL